MLRRFNVLDAVDKVALILYILLACFGWMNIYGASVTDDQTSIFDMSYRSGMQFVWICFSIFVGLVILFSDSNLFYNISYFLYGIIILVLIVTVFVAPDIKGSRSWLPLGPFSIQPAEFSKFITALALAKVISQPQFKLNTTTGYAIVATLIFLPLLIIIAQKETGSALVYASFLFMLYREGLPGIIPMLGFCAVVLFVVIIRFGGVDFLGVDGASLGLVLALILIYLLFLLFIRIYQNDKKILIWFSIVPLAILAILLLVHKIFLPINFMYVFLAIDILATVALLVVALFRWRIKYMLIAAFMFFASAYSFSAGYIFDNILQPHQQMRIKVVLGMANDPTGISYNTNQARIAIGSGGLIGKGFLEGTQTKLKYVPEQDTDFIFCTVGEEWGFLGSVAVLLCYLFFLYRLIFIAERQDTVFVRVYGYSVVGIFAFHLFVNVGMVLGLAPVIGIPLPFFSYGGSSFLSFSILLFILLKLDTKRIERINS